MPRRYLQGTLDFACAIYAVINSLACSHDLGLAGARRIVRETGISLAEAPNLWANFLRNETDHYWLVRYMLGRWCRDAPWKLTARQPFSDCLLPGAGALDLAGAELFLPEKEDEHGPYELDKARKEATAVWLALDDWFSGRKDENRTAVLRFHRFLFQETPPVVSHWTTAHDLKNGVLYLHDASAEKTALSFLKKSMLLPADGTRGLIRIVPESLVLLEPEIPVRRYGG